MLLINDMDFMFDYDTLAFIDQFNIRLVDEILGHIKAEENQIKIEYIQKVIVHYEGLYEYGSKFIFIYEDKKYSVEVTLEDGLISMFDCMEYDE